MKIVSESSLQESCLNKICDNLSLIRYCLQTIRNGLFLSGSCKRMCTELMLELLLELLLEWLLELFLELLLELLGV